jgi:hypothetical protein
MELTEKERLTFVEKKEDMRKLTTEILDLMNKPKKQLELKKKITSVLSLMSTIASYSDSKNYNLQVFTDVANMVFACMNYEELNPIFEYNLEEFCNYANSITFDFTKKGFKINIPKIDISIFKM